MTKNKIYLIDVTNRDGVQTAKLGLAKLEKTMTNLYLNEMGIYQSEFGFPTTKHETNYLNANLELAQMGVLAPIVLSGWCRAIVADVEESVRLTKVQHLNISISTSEQMTFGKFQERVSRRPDLKDPGKPNVIGMTVDAILRAKELGIQTIGVNAEDASRTDDDFLIEFARAARDNGADRIRYCDTLGYDDPFTIYERIKKLAREV
ncbi:homocitrate synthase, partial [bacterium]|nr:homocitrate synthase [bacterium]